MPASMRTTYACVYARTTAAREAQTCTSINQLIVNLKLPISGNWTSYHWTQSKGYECPGSTLLRVATRNISVVEQHVAPREPRTALCTRMQSMTPAYPCPQGFAEARRQLQTRAAHCTGRNEILPEFVNSSLEKVFLEVRALTPSRG